MALSPFHVICIGISPKLSTNQCNTDEGIPYLVSIGMELCNWAFNSFKEGNGFVIMALHVIVALAWVLKIVECVLRPLPLCMLLAAYIGFLHPPPSEMQNFVQGALIFTLQCTHALHLRAYDAPQAESGATIGRKVHRQQVLAHFMFACFIEYSMKNDQQVESTKKKLCSFLLPCASLHKFCLLWTFLNQCNDSLLLSAGCVSFFFPGAS